MAHLNAGVGYVRIVDTDPDRTQTYHNASVIYCTLAAL